MEKSKQDHRQENQSDGTIRQENHWVEEIVGRIFNQDHGQVFSREAEWRKPLMQTKRWNGRIG